MPGAGWYKSPEPNESGGVVQIGIIKGIPLLSKTERRGIFWRAPGGVRTQSKPVNIFFQMQILDFFNDLYNPFLFKFSQETANL